MKDLSLHILDIMRNSVEAGANFIELNLIENVPENLLTIILRDNGKGMTPEQVSKASDPFFTSRTTRKVGLGLSLLKQHAEQSGGRLDIHSIQGTGTKVTATFLLDHIDRPPLGDIEGVVTLMAATCIGLDLVYSHTTTKGTFTFNSREAKEILGESTLNHPALIGFLKTMLAENLHEIGISR